MSMTVLITVSLIFLFIPMLLFIPLYRKFGISLPNKYAGYLWFFLIIYYSTLCYFGKTWLDKFHPLQSHKEFVCEVKTTYSREGIN